MESTKLKISPIVRLNMTFNAEMNLDQRGVFGRETYELYLERLNNSETRLQQMIRSLFLTDAVMLLMTSGQKFTIPGIGLEISQLPAVNEILLFASALSFFFLCASFITNQCYSGIVDQFGNRIVNQDLIDPDFFNASRKHFDFFLKIFRSKLNIWGEDIYQSNSAFSRFCIFLNVLIVFVLLTFPAAHFGISGWSGSVIYNSEINIYRKVFIISVSAIINIGAIMLIVGAYKDFTFSLSQPEAGDGALIPPHASNLPLVADE